MTKSEFYILNNLYNASLRRGPVLMNEHLNEVMRHESEILPQLVKQGYVNPHFGSITQAGIEALSPYRVDNAVILAAGASTRFVPLSLEQPKGLFEVRGEPLIERQIKQLQEAGIRDITLVLGYKKEMFFYLKEKYGVNFIFNTQFQVKNNIHSLYLAKAKLGNTYVCSCDDYFVENPFNQYEYESMYATLEVQKRTNEMYVLVDDEKRIVEMKKGLDHGIILLGHSFWKREFSEAFIALAEADLEVGVYANSFWEAMVQDNLPQLPPFYAKQYASNSIFEFDYFDELRKFDHHYIANTNSRIIHNITSVFNCGEEDIMEFRRINIGMTNISFIFKVNGIDYIYRHPGDGTEKIIVRTNEKTSLQKAKEADIDPTYIYMDTVEGWKISKYVHSFREPDYENFDDSKKILSVLRNLHASSIQVDYGMKPWEDSLATEQLLKQSDPHCFEKFESLKQLVGQLYQRTLGDGVEKCFCHGDTYKPNWMIEPDGHVILIDWEYSGMSDPGIDVGYYIVDAMYDFDTARAFIREYLQDSWTPAREFHYMAYTAIIAYYWFVWAMYRESCGAVMGEALFNWYEMAKRYAEYLA